MNELINEISGKRYLLINWPLTSEKSHRKLLDMIRRYNCILQGVRDHLAGKPVIGVLVPEENVLSFSEESLLPN